MLEANSTTPVKPAQNSVGPSSVMDASTCAALSAPIIEWPSSRLASVSSSSTTGTTMKTLPTTAATCERTRCVTSSTKSSSVVAVSSDSMSLSLAAIAGAVMAGCLVASVKCSSWIMMNVAAYAVPAQKPLQNAERPTATTMNFSSVVSAVTAPPPIAMPSIRR